MSEAKGTNESGEPRRKRLLTLGGCNALEVGKKLSWLYDHTHIWNVTWASLGSEPFELVRAPSEPIFRRIENFIRRETTKEHGQRIAKGGFDLIFISAQMTQYTYVARGDRVMVDFTTEDFINAQQLQNQPRPSVLDYAGKDCRLFTWRDGEYVDRQRQGFERIYETMFRPAMAAGGRVVVYHQRLLSEAMNSEGDIVALNTPDLEARIAVNARVAAIAADKPDLHILGTPEVFAYTGEDAPWGKSEMHPIEEHYVVLAGGLARLDGQEIEVELFRRHIGEMRQRAMANRRTLIGLDTRAARFEKLSSESEARAKHAENELEVSRRSLSWQVTKPLRVARRLLAGGSKAPKAP